MEVPIDTIDRVRELMPVSTLTMLTRPLNDAEAQTSGSWFGPSV